MSSRCLVISVVCLCALFSTVAFAANVRFVTAADMRGPTPEQPVNSQSFGKILKLMKEEKPELVFLPGDLIYGSRDPKVYGKQLEVFKGLVSPYIDMKILYPCLGNHDTCGEEHTKEYRKTFQLPKNGPTGYEDEAYYVEYGGSLFVVVATDHQGESGLISDKQLKWLDTVFSSHKSAEHIFVFGHQPAFPVGPHVLWSLDQHPVSRDRFWALLRHNNVDAYFCGHEHLFAMNHVEGVWQVIAGTAGAPMYKGYEGEFFHYALIKTEGRKTTFTIKDESGAVRREWSMERDPNYVNVTQAELLKATKSEILNYLENGPDNAAVVAAWAAGERKIKEAIPALMKRLADKQNVDKDTKYRVHAIRALGLMKAKELLPFIKANKDIKNWAMALELEAAQKKILGK